MAVENIEKFVSLHKNENVLMKLRQSYLSSISPDTIILTDRRVVIVHHSFWGLYFNHNILSPTKVSTVMLGNIMGTTTADGKILATVNIRIRGSGEEQALSGSGWHIDGIRIKKAMDFTEMLEELIEDQENAVFKDINLIDKPKLKEAIQNDSKAMVIWLGVEPADSVAYMLGIGIDKIMRVNPADIPNMSLEGIKDLEGKILACSSGTISAQIAALLKREYHVNTYVLKDGLMGTINTGRGKDNNVSR